MSPNDARKALTVLLLGFGVFLPSGCGEEVEPDVVDEVVECKWAEAMSDATQEMTPWPLMGTVSKPSFGKGCRYSVDTTHELESNCEKDDVISLEGPPDGVVNLDMTIRHEGSEVLDISVQLERSLVGKAYYAATGTGNWHGEDAFGGEVLDGTLCFSEKLSIGTPVSGEFSLIIEDDTGARHSVGGRFLLDGPEIIAESPINVTSLNTDFDLR
jgi:hypothetical protein